MRKRGQPAKHAKKRVKWGDKEEAIRKNPSQYGSRARSQRVARDLSPWRSAESLHGSWPLAVRLLKNYIAPYFDQVSYHLSLSSNKSPLEQTPPLSINLGFFFPVFSPSWKVFSLTISTLMIFRFSSLVLSSSGWEVFHQLILCPVFLLSLPIIGLGGFSPATWSFETHQLPHGARMFSLVPRFSSSVSHHWVGRFFTRFPFKFPFNDSTLSGARVWRGRQL